MANIVNDLDTIELTDLEDNSKLTVVVRSCSELGNRALPGVQVHFMGYIANFEPLQAERWAYQARKAGQDAILLESASWNVHDDQFVKVSLVLGEPPRARVEAKVRSATRPVVREYALPFQFQE